MMSDKKMAQVVDKQKTEASLSAAESSLACTSEIALRVPCYCEENVWRLAYRRLYSDPPQNEDISDSMDTSSSSYLVVFISNEIQCVPMFYQKARDTPEEACFWDYHVILLRTSRTNDKSTRNNSRTTTTEVLDMDTHLDYPSPLNRYLDFSFAADFEIEQNRKFAPLFRVVPAAEFIDNFCSDRMHMYNKATDTWNAPPPTYECIQTRGSKTFSNVQDFISMRIPPTGDEEETLSNKNNGMGTVITLEQLRERYSDTK